VSDAAEADLTEVFELSERCEMRLHLTDCHLQYTALRQAQGRDDEAQTHWEKARDLIEATGYHRRDAELAALKK
jgi:hypothetical protein